MGDDERISRRPIASTSILRRQIGPFGLKDVFTLVNLLSGVVAVRFALSGHPRAAGYAIVVGYLGGDVLDGAVARLTRTGNRFGAEFDSITDHFVHVVVPAIVFYTVYERAHHGWLGLAAVAVLISSATIRHARLAVDRFSYPCWCGLPRTIAGFAALSFPLSTWFFNENPVRYWSGFVVVVVMSALTLLPIPYRNHRGAEPLALHLKVFVGLFFVLPVIVLVVDHSYAFDVFFFFVAGYAATGWVPIGREERRRFYAEYRRWAAEVAH